MLLFRSFREDLVEMIKDSEPTLFEGCGKMKEEILADNNLLDRMWGIYQKGIEDYNLEGCESFRSTLEDVLGIPAET